MQADAQNWAQGLANLAWIFEIEIQLHFSFPFPSFKPSHTPPHTPSISWPLSSSVVIAYMYVYADTFLQRTCLDCIYHSDVW